MCFTNYSLYFNCYFDLSQTAVAEFARQQNIALLPWPLELNSLDLYDLGVLVSFGRLVPRKVISKFPQ